MIFHRIILLFIEVFKSLLEPFLPCFGPQLYHSYFTTSEAIAIHRKVGPTVKYSVVIILLAVQSLHHLYLVLASPLPTASSIVQYNVSYLFLRNDIFNIVWLLLALLSGMFYYNLYFRINYRVHQILYAIMFDPMEKCDGLFCDKIYREGETVCQFIRRRCLSHSRRFQLFLIVCRK